MPTESVSGEGQHPLQHGRPLHPDWYSQWPTDDSRPGGGHLFLSESSRYVEMDFSYNTEVTQAVTYGCCWKQGKTVTSTTSPNNFCNKNKIHVIYHCNESLLREIALMQTKPYFQFESASTLWHLFHDGEWMLLVMWLNSKKHQEYEVAS